jgi:hypothetical protein
MNLTNIRALVQRKSGHPVLNLDDAAVDPLRNLLVHPDINDYVRHCLPQETYLASQNQLAVQSLKGIIDEMHPESSPGGCITQFGYLVVATSAGGNGVCFHSATGRVFWADHDTFAPSGIYYQDGPTGKLIFLEQYSAEDVQRPMVPLSDSIEQFLVALLSDQLTAQLASLD